MTAGSVTSNIAAVATQPVARNSILHQAMPSGASTPATTTTPAALVDAVTAAREPRAVSAASASMLDIQAQLVSTLSLAFPDIRAYARHCVEAEIKRRRKLSINADQTYFNLFSGGRQDTLAASGWRHDQSPLRSHTLAEMQLRHLVQHPTETSSGEHAGIYYEGQWAVSFSECNEVALNAAELKDILAKSGFDGSYRRRLESFLSRNLGAMQALAETETMAYVEGHLRANARAQALGIDPMRAARLQLGDGALAMLASAMGRPDPDFGRLGVKAYVFDINGYPARDMIWLHAEANGHVLLVMPGNERHLRHYPSLAAMRADIRAMAADNNERRELASHFSAYNRSDGSFYQGVDSWLRDIRAGGYDDRIGYKRQPFSGDLGKLTGIRRPATYGEPFLSDKAIAMLSEAAGCPDPDFLAQHTEAFVLDIDSYASKDMSWLRSGDGHVVLLMPGSSSPVREYRDLAAMRADLHALCKSKQGRAQLAAHFSRLNRQDGSIYQGVDKWLANIGNGGYDERIAYKPARITGSVFRNQLERMRDARLAMFDDIKEGRINSASERQRWLQSFGAFNPLLLGTLTEDERAASSERIEKRPDWRDIVYGGRSGERMRRWSSDLRQRVTRAVDRLTNWVFDTRVIQDAHSRPPSPRTTTPECVTPQRVPNAMGFLERSDFQVLYRIEPVFARRRAELDGLLPDGNFIVDNAIDGAMVGAFLTREAALQWWWSEQANIPFRLYEIDARGLRGVSFGDNRANLPGYGPLRDDVIERTAGNRRGLHWFYINQQMNTLEEQLVHVNIDGLRSERVQPVRGVGAQPPLRRDDANPLEMDDVGPWFYDGDEDLWEFDLEAARCV